MRECLHGLFGLLIILTVVLLVARLGAQAERGPTPRHWEIGRTEHTRVEVFQLDALCVYVADNAYYAQRPPALVVVPKPPQGCN